MTREEAIKALTKERKTALHENKQAFDMAIKALKNQPKFIIHSDGTIEQIIELCEDCISRKAALDIFEEIKETYPRIYTAIEVRIRLLPSVTPKPKEIYNKGWKDGAEATAYHVELCEEENPTIPLSVIEEIKAEIKEEIKHWELRKPPIEETKVGYTSCVNSEHSTKIRNPKEIEYIRYAERIGGLDMALEIIDNHIAERGSK